MQVDQKVYVVHARRCNFHGSPFKAVGNGVHSNLGIASGGNITWKILLPSILSIPESVFGANPAVSLRHLRCRLEVEGRNREKEEKERGIKRKRGKDRERKDGDRW